MQAKRYQGTKKPTLSSGLMLALPIFPASHPASIVGASELNFCVRDGNRWTLTAINTNSISEQNPVNGLCSVSARQGCRALQEYTLKTEQEWRSHDCASALQPSLLLFACVGQAFGLLVSVSSMPYSTYTPDLSTT